MGQRLLKPTGRRKTRQTVRVAVEKGEALCVFPTELGWFGLCGRGDTVTRLSIGHTSAEQVRHAFKRSRATGAIGEPIPERDWNPRLRRALEDFARGIPRDFTDVAVDLERISPFRKRALCKARRISYGKTASYRDLAVSAGNPLAARAVGSAMASNPIPIIIPCHRIVATGGSIGGFSAPQGVELKQRMLEMEAAAYSRTVKNR